MVNLANGFTERGIAVDLVLLSARGPLLQEVVPAVNIHDLGVSRARASIGPLVHYLRHHQPDALISALGQTNLAAAVARSLSTTRVRLLVSEHQSFEPGREPGLIQKLFPGLARRLYRNAVVVAVSDGVADTLAQVSGIPRTGIEVIANPVLVPGLQQRSLEPLPAGAPARYILNAGRLTAQKNQALLLDGFALLAEAEPDLQLVILGEGELENELRQQAERLGIGERVLMPGFQSNPYPWIRQASAFVLSSDWEGLPTVLIEALALGVPVVSTDAPSGPAEILDGGRLGRLVPRNDPRALADALRAVLTQPAERATAAELDKYTVRSAVSAYIHALGLN